jgi:hypothetical protein
MCEGGCETREDLGEFGAQQRCGDVGRDEIEKVDNGASSVFVGDSLGGDLAAEKCKKGGEICGWCEWGVLLAERVFDCGEHYRKLEIV